MVCAVSTGMWRHVGGVMLSCVVVSASAMHAMLHVIRWGSIDEIEKLLDHGGHVLGKVFSEIFANPSQVFSQHTHKPIRCRTSKGLYEMGAHGVMCYRPSPPFV